MITLGESHAPNLVAQNPPLPMKLASRRRDRSEVSMPRKPSTQDTRLIVQLYHLRQEREMRKARHWWLVDFWPRSPEDYLKVEKARRTPESNWLRQLISYWGMASSFVLDGTLSERAFLEPAFSREMFVFFAKVHPFLKELREKTLNPELMRNIEKVITGSKRGLARLQQVSKGAAARRGILSQTAARKNGWKLTRVQPR